LLLGTLAAGIPEVNMAMCVEMHPISDSRLPEFGVSLEGEKKTGGETITANPYT